jgi:hypothetical protein
MDLNKITILTPIVLVSTERNVKSTSGNYSAKIIKTREQSEFVVGQTVFADSNCFVSFRVNDEDIENTYQLREDVIKGIIEE